MGRFSHYCALILIGVAQVTAAAGPYRAPAQLDDGWLVANAAKAGWDVDLLTSIEDGFADGTYAGITSMLIAHKGRLVHEAYFDGGGIDVLNDMRSATKSVTALLVGAAIDRGLIDGADMRVYDYFPGERPAGGLDPRLAAITVEDLLTMSSMWECNDDNPFSSGNEERMYVSERWLRFALALPVRGFAPWTPRPEDSPYGRAFSYCTAGSFVLGAIIERASGQFLGDFAKRALHEPLGIGTTQWNRSSEGIGMGGGGTRYRSRDIAKIGEMVRMKGRWKGKRILSEAWIEVTLTSHAQARTDAEYGYQIWRLSFAKDGEARSVWAMSGNGGNYVFISPLDELVAVVTSSSYNQREAHPRSRGIFRNFILPAMPRVRSSGDPAAARRP